ncbi:hypothetical protein HRTV-28_gp17 [Halorubrum tailed virus 28]|uniref:Uncharacterized protein n=1 Tax=Halorubrum tailed virus 28 TaxID=2878009 RepID=A0AAE9BYC6_9CAUD|nr:hypothetical protein M1M39_gp18 [Halorubrum tailed virus 28]UBF23455.1 hypothetical protein HRTV-28_gp17 [Halorubrum tailed virus 28]
MLLQTASEGSTNTALMEVLLFVITILLGVIGWGARKAYHDLQSRLEAANSRRTQNRDDIDDHSYMLYGSDKDTWDGVYSEVKKNRRGINQHREVLDQHGEKIGKHESALRREDMIGPEPPREDAPNAEDLVELNRIGDGGDD